MVGTRLLLPSHQLLLALVAQLGVRLVELLGQCKTQHLDSKLEVS